MINLILNLIFAHIIADFYLQSNTFCEGKQFQGLHGKNIYIHASIVFLLSVFAFGSAYYCLPAFLIAITHLLIDYLKSIVDNHLDKKKECSRYKIFSFAVDQMLHFAVIAIISWIVINHCAWNQFDAIKVFGLRLYSCIIAFAICAKPANILIKLVLNYCQVNVIGGNEKDENFKAGALIGTLERWLIIIFMCINQYEAIGFLVAAKSILRFNELKESEKSEYVLSGTLLSLFVALIAGWTILHI